MSVNSKMTAIADELRALMGATGALTLDGMAQQAGAANDAADAQAGLIAQIAEALEGKAGASGGAKVAYGRITPSADTGSLTIEHNLGVVPDYVLIFMMPGYSSTTRANGLRSSYITTTNTRPGDAYVTATNAFNFQHDASAGLKWELNATSATATEYYSNGNLVKFLASIPYGWICVAADGMKF